MSDTQHGKTIERGKDDGKFDRAEDNAPDKPTDLPKSNWKGVLKRTLSEFGKDGGSDLAAALTYFAILSIAPMILALSTMLSFFGQDGATQDVVEDLGGQLGLEQSTLETVNGYLDTMGQAEGAGILLVVGLVGALWSASNYVNAFSRMMNKVYEIEEGRPVWKLRPWLLAVTLLLVLGLITIILSITLSGAVSEAIFGAIGLSGTVNTVWNIAKWPVIVLILMLMVAVLYWATPNVRQPSFTWLSPGAALAVIVAILAAAGFFLYLTGFGGEDSYNATYGAIGGVIILLLMIFIINNVLVIGAELDAELERGRELAAGMPAEDSILLPPRDVKGTEKKQAKQAELVREAREERMDAAGQLREQGKDVGLEGRVND